MQSFQRLIVSSLCCLCVAMFSMAVFAANHHQPVSPSAVGYWQTMDNSTKQPDSIVQIWDEQGQLKGKVVKLFKDPDALCSKCAGEQHGKPIQGMTILWGFSPAKPGTWIDGQILAVRRGMTFDADIVVASDSQSLKLVVTTGFGERIKNWQRVAAPKE